MKIIQNNYPKYSQRQLNYFEYYNLRSNGMFSVKTDVPKKKVEKVLRKCSECGGFCSNSRETAPRCRECVRKKYIKINKDKLNQGGK